MKQFLLSSVLHKNTWNYHTWRNICITGNANDSTVLTVKKKKRKKETSLNLLSLQIFPLISLFEVSSFFFFLVFWQFRCPKAASYTYTATNSSTTHPQQKSLIVNSFGNTTEAQYKAGISVILLKVLVRFVELAVLVTPWEMSNDTSESRRIY